MPDLIIKPAAQSGNKVIIQDQAGGAVVTTADSGATIANATLTTPTIANMANCTFPAGHVIQTFYAEPAGGSSLTSSGTVSHLTITLSNITSGSKVFLIFKYLYKSDNSGSTVYAHHYIASTNASTMGLATTTGHSHSKVAHEIGRYGGAAWKTTTFTGSVLTGAVTTATPTYNIYHQQIGSFTAYFSGDYVTIVAMEIAQ